MHPILFQFGPITLHTYGLLVASGFLLGIAWSARLARREQQAQLVLKGLPGQRAIKVTLGPQALLAAIEVEAIALQEGMALK